VPFPGKITNEHFWCCHKYLTLCHNLVAKDLATWTHSGVYLAHYIDCILLTSHSLAELEEAEVSLQLVLSQWGWVATTSKCKDLTIL
jgi:hypothetical protein